MKNKIAAIVSAVLMTVAIAFAGFAAPAQADVEPMRTGSYVTFDYIQTDIPKTIDFHLVKVSGSFFYLSWHETLSNVKYVCPKSDDYRLGYINPSGAGDILDPGECLWPQFQGHYHVGYYRAF